jgi:hypothetical protein
MSMTLADQLTYESDIASGHGVMVETNIAWKETINFSIRYDREGKNRPHWILFNLMLSPWDDYHLRLFYAADDPMAGGDIISYNALMAVAIRGRIWGPLDGYGYFSRRFRRQNDAVLHVNEVAGGLGVSLTY